MTSNKRPRRQREVQKMAEVREKSFRHASYLSITAVLLSAVFYCFIMRDVRRRQAFQQRLEELNRKNETLLKARKNMMMTVSHDLRTPLTAISGYAELISVERQKEKRIRYSETIRESAGRMLGLLNTLLKFYRLDAGKEQPENHPFRLKTLLETLENDLMLLAAKKRIAYTCKYDSEDVVVSGDREKILQITDNLLSNAIKFTDLGEVTLYMSYNDSQLIIKVQDTGTGMTGSQIEHIFQPFERLGNAETQEGFGLGLAITLAMVELLGGKIYVESEKGIGSLFTVHIPLPVANEENPTPKTDMPSFLPANLRILIIDDDPVLLAMTMDMLSCNGIYCEGCRSVRDLMELLREYTYDLLITDIKMPEMNGYQLLELLRCSNIGISKTLPILASTACVDCNTENFTSVGFAGCLYKPFSQAELLSAIQDCIGREQYRKHIGRADFSTLLTGERDNKEMLDLFINETERNMVALKESITGGDIKTLSSITHHLLPLWGLVRMDNSLKSMQSLLYVPSGKINEEIRQAVHDVMAQGNSIIRQARMRIDQMDNGQDTDYRG